MKRIQAMGRKDERLFRAFAICPFGMKYASQPYGIPSLTSEAHWKVEIHSVQPLYKSIR